MVSIGSGGVFNGITYMDNDELKTGEDYILDRISYAKGQQYITLFWQNLWGHKGYRVFDPAKAGGGGLDRVII